MGERAEVGAAGGRRVQRQERRRPPPDLGGDGATPQPTRAEKGGADATHPLCVAGRERGPIGERAETPVGLGSRSGSERKKGRGGGRTDKGKRSDAPHAP